MLKRYSDGTETFIHVCNDINKKTLANLPIIYLHDVHAYVVIDSNTVFIKYCPFCGVLIDNEERQ